MRNGDERKGIKTEVTRKGKWGWRGEEREITRGGYKVWEYDKFSGGGKYGGEGRGSECMRGSIGRRGKRGGSDGVGFYMNLLLEKPFL